LEKKIIRQVQKYYTAYFTMLFFRPLQCFIDKAKSTFSKTTRLYGKLILLKFCTILIINYLKILESEKIENDRKLFRFYTEYACNYWQTPEKMKLLWKITKKTTNRWPLENLQNPNQDQ
jgi:hypothetical protein